jgi:DNA-binding IclR family transcriptional regulator
MNREKKKTWKSKMHSETVIGTQKRMRSRTSAPNAHELLGQIDRVEMRLLHWLLRYPFQQAEDLNLAAGISLATVYRHLNTLHNVGLIECILPSMLGIGACRLYHLSNLGLHVLAAHEQADPAELARAWSTDEHGLLRLLPRLSSLVSLQECINGLVAHSPEALAHQGHRPEVRWHWVRDYAHRFLFREKLMHCTADAALLFRVRPQIEDGTNSQEQWYSLFVLHDAEIADAKWIKQHLGRLLCYRESAERWPVYQHFPPVFVLVSTSHRMELWQRCAMEAAAPLHLAPLTGAIVCLPLKQQKMSFNSWRLAWKGLATNGPCSLQHLLHPLPFEATPPGLWDYCATDSVMPGETLRDDGTPTTSPTRKRTRIIVGNYMDLANAVQKDHPGDSHDEREIIALLGLSLGHRHLDLLKLLFTYPLLHIREMALLLDLEVSSIERYLGALCRRGCVVPMVTDGGKRWRLSERGLRFIAAMHHVNIQRIAKIEESDNGTTLVQQGLDVLLRHLEHTAGIYGFFASLSQAAMEERTLVHDHRLLWWETGAACERRYRDHDHWHNLRPDALAEYQARDRRVHFWLEWDRGTMATRDLAIKFRTYGQYMASREWFKQETTLPLLLVVTPDQGQEMRIDRVAKATLTDSCGLIIRTTTLTRLRRQGLLGTIWNQVFPQSEGNGLTLRRTFYL